MTEETVYAETEDPNLLDTWQGTAIGSSLDRYRGGNPYFVMFDEKDEDKPEMAKQFRLMFRAQAENHQDLIKSLEEAGFTPVYLETVKRTARTVVGPSDMVSPIRQTVVQELK